MKKSDVDKHSAYYKEGNRILHVLCVIGLLFLTLTVYLTYFEVFEKEEYVNHVNNMRLLQAVRGDVFDRNGVILVESYKNDKSQTRVSNYGELYAHVIGYCSAIYQKTELEKSYDTYLSGTSEFSNFTNLFSIGEEKKGDTLHLTISHEMQEKAYSMLAGRNGSVVAMNPKTGEILCMASNPTFNSDPTYLEENWNEIEKRTDSPFVNRATNSLYAPGSIFKTIILSAALENGLEDIIIDDKGIIDPKDGEPVSNSGGKAYGKIGLKRAYSVSSNVAFITVGEKLGFNKVKKYIEKFKISEEIDFDIPVKKSVTDYNSGLAQTCIGQGGINVTPLQMAMMVSTIANDGIIQNPYLVEKIVNMSGVTVCSADKKELGRAIETETARTVQEYMVDAVENGTGKNAAVKGLKVGGKTGTAENERENINENHTWFVGFAEKGDEKIAVAVCIEFAGGSGGENAAPIARELFKIWKDTV